MARRYIGPNWTLLTRLSLVIMLGLGLFLVFPIATCSLSAMGGVNLTQVGQNASGHDGRSSFQTQTVAEARGFVGGMLGTVRSCSAQYPIQQQPIAVQFTALGGFVGFLLFSILGRISTRREIRRAADQQRKARQGLQRERSSRTTTGGGHPTVAEAGPLGARPRAASSGPRVVPRGMTSGSVGLAGSPFEERDDLFSRMDDAFAESGEQRATTERAEPLPRPPRVTGSAGHVFAEDVTAVPARASSSPGRVDVAPTAAARELSSANLPDLNDVDDARWAEDDAWAPEPIAEAVDLYGGDTLAPGESSLAAALDAHRPSAPARPLTRATRVHEVHATGALDVGGETEIVLRADGLDDVATCSVRVAAAIVSPSGELLPAFEERALGAFRTVSETTNGAVFTLRWADVALAALETARGLATAAPLARVYVRDGLSEQICDVPLTDTFRARITDQYGGGFEDVLLVVRDATGMERAARPDAEGAVTLGGLVPGVVAVLRADRGLLQPPGGALRVSTELATTGVAFALPSGAVDEARTHELVAWRANRIWVDPQADAGDGSSERPFGSIDEALVAIRARRHAATHALDYDEVRLRGAKSHPGQRVGALRAANGDGPWWPWWGGGVADRTRTWFQKFDAKECQRRVAAHLEGALREDVSLHGLDRIRLIGGPYAETFDRWNEGRETPTLPIEQALAAIPLAVLGRPADELTQPFRLVLRESRHASVVGIHLAGGRGQSGIDMREVYAAYVYRCWIDGFESGSTSVPGVVAVGRGIQIEDSGGEGGHDRVFIERCDIGFNRAQRRSMPIRGAGVAVYDSRIELAHCILHNNQSTQDPAGLYGDRKSLVRGAGNHREANEAI